MPKCKACGREIVFIKTKRSSLLPCDPPVVAVVLDSGTVVRGRVPHWATCSDPERFRRRKAVPEPS